MISGSLPAGVESRFVRELIGVAKRAGCRVCADLSGAALQAVLDLPLDILKPNDTELQEVLGLQNTDEQSLQNGVQQLLNMGHAAVLLSLGANGAWLCRRGNGGKVEIFKQNSFAVDVVSTVGAGDSFLAGYLAHEHEAPAEALRWAAAFGASAVTHHAAHINPQFLPKQIYVQNT